MPALVPARLRCLARRRADRAAAARLAEREAMARIQSELADALPDEDVRDDLADCLDFYETGSKPRCEEREYLDLVQEALDRAERGG
ncbi:hypothetical protein AB0C51_06905 [Streptomyces pathocidini]|uniref:hypothetical protein n=1 Tax=Streptomyces pathocidini TaxID=1650571 RepID=UPI0033D37608